MAFLFPGVFGTASYLLRSPFLKGIQGRLGDLTPAQAPGEPQDGRGAQEHGLDLVTVDTAMASRSSQSKESCYEQTRAQRQHPVIAEGFADFSSSVGDLGLILGRET